MESLCCFLRSCGRLSEKEEGEVSFEQEEPGGKSPVQATEKQREMEDSHMRSED